MPAPQDCRSKDDIRREVDRLDRALIALFAERFAYIRRMAELKREPDEALDVARVAEVMAKVRAEASGAGFDPDLAEELWRRLVDWNVAWERAAIERRNRGG